MLKNNTSHALINKNPPIGVIGPKKDKDIPIASCMLNK